MLVFTHNFPITLLVDMEMSFIENKKNVATLVGLILTDFSALVMIIIIVIIMS